MLFSFDSSRHFSISGQILCALIGASINSGHTNVSPPLLSALVVHDTWSIATTFSFVDRMKELLPEREPVYALADIIVQSREEPHDVIVDEIVAALPHQLALANGDGGRL